MKRQKFFYLSLRLQVSPSCLRVYSPVLSLEVMGVKK